MLDDARAAAGRLGSDLPRENPSRDQKWWGWLQAVLATTIRNNRVRHSHARNVEQESEVKEALNTSSAVVWARRSRSADSVTSRGQDRDAGI